MTIQTKETIAQESDWHGICRKYAQKAHDGDQKALEFFSKEYLSLLDKKARFPNIKKIRNRKEAFLYLHSIADQVKQGVYDKEQIQWGMDWLKLHFDVLSVFGDDVPFSKSTAEDHARVQAMNERFAHEIDPDEVIEEGWFPVEEGEKGQEGQEGTLDHE